MDAITAAAGLRDLLVAHDNADRQVSTLEAQIEPLSRQLFSTTMDGAESHDLHTVLRLSVREGVRDMYRQYKTKKWQQVQDVARSITESLTEDMSEEHQTTPPRSGRSRQRAPAAGSTRSPAGGSTSRDKAADRWTSAFCEFYRDS